MHNIFYYILGSNLILRYECIIYIFYYSFQLLFN
nr:MAG TPA: hypothetical protein [Bacteriophage sp.]